MSHLCLGAGPWGGVAERGGQRAPGSLGVPHLCQDRGSRAAGQAAGVLTFGISPTEMRFPHRHRCLAPPCSSLWHLKSGSSLNVPGWLADHATAPPVHRCTRYSPWDATGKKLALPASTWSPSGWRLQPDAKHVQATAVSSPLICRDEHVFYS